MKFSLHYTLQSKGSWNSTYRDFLSEAALAERLGFHALYVGEHHFAPDGWCPSPVTALASAAAVTSRMKLGTDIIVLPLHDPVRVAEDIAVLDNFSNGRSIVGIGLGYRREEYAAFATDFEKKKEIYESKIETVKRLLQKEAVRVNGVDVKVYPTPVQEPRPPVWLAAKSDAAIKSALVRGEAWIMDPVTPLSLLNRKMRMYREVAKKTGKEVRDFPLRRECFVSKDERKLEKAERLILESYKEDYYSWGHLMTGEGDPVDPKLTSFDELREPLLEEMLVGTPPEVVEKLEAYRGSLGATEMLLKLMFPGITHSMREECITLIGHDIVPAFRGEA